jgi:hypothetical protein
MNKWWRCAIGLTMSRLVAVAWPEAALVSGNGETAVARPPWLEIRRGEVQCGATRGCGSFARTLWRCLKAWPATGVGGGWCSPRRQQWRVGGGTCAHEGETGCYFIGGQGSGGAGELFLEAREERGGRTARQARRRRRWRAGRPTRRGRRRHAQ